MQFFVDKSDKQLLLLSSFTSLGTALEAVILNSQDNSSYMRAKIYFGLWYVCIPFAGCLP